MNFADVRAALPNLGPLESSAPVAEESVPRETPTETTPKNEGGKVTMPAGRWTKYAGKLGAALTVTTSAAVIRRQGYEPNDPDDADVALLQEALAEGLALRFGDGPVPWWLGATLAAGGVYAGMRIGARPIARPPQHLTPDVRPEQQPEPMAVVPQATHRHTNPFGFSSPPPVGPSGEAIKTE